METIYITAFILTLMVGFLLGMVIGMYVTTQIGDWIDKKRKNG